MWRPVAELLKRDHDVFAPTLPGHLGGPTPGPSAATTFVDAVERMMDGVGWERAHVAGNSLGGWIALDLARRGRALSVTAFAPAGGWRKHTLAAWRLGASFLPWYPMARLAGPWARPLMASPTRRRLLLLWVLQHGDRVAPEDAAHFVESLGGCSVYFDVLREAIGSDGIERMHEVRCPVHVVFSEHDRVVPAHTFGGRFLEEIPHATHETLADAGHVPMLDQPERVADIVRRHARS
jgi:pimeloyl-ACP methyl ester carboxylesterase